MRGGADKVAMTRRGRAIAGARRVSCALEGMETLAQDRTTLLFFEMFDGLPCWTRPDPPPDRAAFWAREYPAIRDMSAILAAIHQCGYETVGHFPMPRSSWDDYYRPLRENVTAFRLRHEEETDAQELADRVQREIDVWRSHAEFHSYEFSVMRAR
jgi:hypothetical protein